MERKKLALVVVLVVMMFTSSLAKLASGDFEENENGNNQLLSDGSNDRAANYEIDNPRKMMKDAAPPPPRPQCFGDFCGGALLPCDSPCVCITPTGAERGYCVDFYQT